MYFILIGLNLCKGLNFPSGLHHSSAIFENLSKDKKIIKKIPVNKLKKLFNLGYHSKKINIIFKRALKK